MDFVEREIQKLTRAWSNYRQDDRSGARNRHPPKSKIKKKKSK